MSTREKNATFFMDELMKIYPGWIAYPSKMAEALEDEQYITVDVLAEYDIGNQERWDVAIEEIAVVGLREATISIQAFGKGSVELLSTLSAHLERPSIVDEFFVANISVNDVQPVQDLTDLLDNNFFYERGSVDLTVTYDRTVIDNPGWFETIRISGVLVEGDLINAAVPSKIKIETNIEIKEKP